MRQSQPPNLYAVSRDKPPASMPAIIGEAIAAGLVVQFMVPREGRWKITRRDGMSFFFWQSTGRWHSCNQNQRINGYDVEGLRRWLDLTHTRAA